ncbi:MAG TPA: hypothetical protein PKA58_30690 [Polyangium sp.]|nr:hypothetical protein [Polyangium sp.]
MNALHLDSTTSTGTMEPALGGDGQAVCRRLVDDLNPCLTQVGLEPSREAL